MKYVYCLRVSMKSWWLKDVRLKCVHQKPLSLNWEEIRCIPKSKSSSAAMLFSFPCPLSISLVSVTQVLYFKSWSWPLCFSFILLSFLLAAKFNLAIVCQSFFFFSFFFLTELPTDKLYGGYLVLGESLDSFHQGYLGGRLIGKVIYCSVSVLNFLFSTSFCALFFIYPSILSASPNPYSLPGGKKYQWEWQWVCLSVYIYNYDIVRR